jgi:predicted pyridoxine 5'-phosphate oxidase superfamily flavin-nucleotide-binding protein
LDAASAEAHDWAVSGLYHEGNRELQDRFDTRRLADRIAERLDRTTFDADDSTFIQSRDMFFLATADEHGMPQCSYKGGEPGFVRVVDEQTLAFPNYDGNGTYLSMGNLLVNPQVGILFIDFVTPKRLRVSGTASVVANDPLLDVYPEAQFVVRVRATHVLPNCPRYVHRMEVVERSRFVPHAGRETPVPDWKRRPWSHDALPAADPARAEGLLPD